MTTKEIFDLSGEINDRLNDYRNDMASAIIVVMNDHGVDEIDLLKAREDCKKNGLLDVSKRIEHIVNKHIVRIKYGETLEYYIDRVIIRDLGFVYCVCRGVKYHDFEITDDVRTLNIYDTISVMELVTEYFDAMDEIAKKQ